ncbi:hypothetical protein EC957_011234, partial [Mortierella hygrophila]
KTTNVFDVEIEPFKTISNLKQRIKSENPVAFNGVDAKDLTFWRVSIKDNDVSIVLDPVPEPGKEKLRATSELSDVFKETPPKKTIHIIVHRLPPELVLNKQARTSSDETLRSIVEDDIGKFSGHHVVTMVAPSGSGKTATVIDLAVKHFVVF